MQKYLSYWKSENIGSILLKLVLFVLWPFVGYIFSLFSANRKSSCFILFIFAILYGFSFTPNYANYSDAQWYIDDFQNVVSVYSLRDYINLLTDILLQRVWTKDIYNLTVSFFVSRFTNDYHYLFLIYAIIFGYFMIRSLVFLTANKEYTFSVTCILLTILFLFNGIYNINGVRFWTAAWVGVYALLNILVKDRSRYIILLLVTILIHKSFLFLILITIIYYVLSSRKKGLWMPLYYSSFLLSLFSTQIAGFFTNVLPVDMSAFDMYIEGAAQGNGVRSETGNILITLSSLYINGLFLILMRHGVSSDYKKLFFFVQVFLTAVNIVMPIPSLGVRFYQLTFPLLAVLWLKHMKDAKFGYYLYFLPIGMFYHIYISIILFVEFVPTDFFLPGYLLYLM